MKFARHFTGFLEVQSSLKNYTSLCSEVKSAQQKYSALNQKLISQ